MSKSITIRMSDDDLCYLDYLFRRYYGSDLVSNDKLNLPLSPVIRASFKLLYQILSANPDVCLEDPDTPYRLPDRFYPECYDLDTGEYIYSR